MNSIFCCIINWGSLADFLSLGIFAGIAIFVYCADRKRHGESTKLEKDLNRPTIGFKLNKKEDINSYCIVNYGKGSALNIVAAYKDKIKDKVDDNWKDHYMCYSLKESEERLLKWKSGGHIWIVRYNDIFTNVYFTICQDDTIEIIEMTDKSNKFYKTCSDFEDYVQKNISNKEIIKRYWTLE